MHEHAIVQPFFDLYGSKFSRFSIAFKSYLLDIELMVRLTVQHRLLNFSVVSASFS